MFNTLQISVEKKSEQYGSINMKSLYEGWEQSIYVYICCTRWSITLTSPRCVLTDALKSFYASFLEDISRQMFSFM